MTTSLLPVEAKDHNLDLGDFCIHWTSWHEHSDARPLVLLHGFMGSGQDFEAWMPHITRPCLAPDLPYHGQSRHQDERPWDIPRAIDMLARWLDVLGHERVDLLGYSMGGRMALHWPLHQPERVEKLMLIGASPGLQPSHDSPVDLAKQRRLQDEHLALDFERQTMDEVLASWRQKPIIQSQATIPEPWLGRMNARRLAQSPSQLAQSLRHMGTGTMNLWKALDKITCPTLLLTGQGDAKFTAIAQDMLTHLPNARHEIIDGVGHSCHVEAIDSSVALTSTFLDQTP